MFHMDEGAMLVQDREDLIGLLRMRFGSVSQEIIEQINGISNLDTVERLILVAAETEEWQKFVSELRAGEEAFRIPGKEFAPFPKIPFEESGDS